MWIHLGLIYNYLDSLASLPIQTPDKTITIENDFVLAMTGYLPDYNFFKKIGIKFQDDEYQTPIHNEATLETNIPNLYIAGVIKAGKYTSKYFIENTREHAAMIIKHIRSQV